MLAPLNPFREFPVLELDNGRTFFEPSVIVECIDQSFAGPALLPDDPQATLEVRQIERIVDSRLNRCRQLLLDDSQLSPQDRDGPPVCKARKDLDTTCGMLDARLEHNEWLVGDTFTIADCCAAPTLHYLGMVHDIEPFLHLNAYLSRLYTRPSVTRTLRDGVPQMKALLSKMNYPLSWEPAFELPSVGNRYA